MPDVASYPDLLRLLTIPFFGYVAWRDIKTRRVPNRTWLPLAALALVLLVWELFTVSTGGDPVARQQFYIQVAVSIGFLIPISYLFWRIGGFGGADAKAFFVIAALFPTFPAYDLWRFGLGGLLDPFPGVAHSQVLPAVEPTLGVFSITILSNTVLFGALYPVVLAARNAVTGYVSPGMFVARPVAWDRTVEEYGTLLEFPDRRLRDDLSLSGLSEYSNWRGLDLDALRMYLQWRGLTIEQLREHPGLYRNPASLTGEKHAPGDGAITTESRESDGGVADSDGAEVEPDAVETGSGPDGEFELPDIDSVNIKAGVETGSGPDGGFEPYSPEAFLDELPAADDPWGAAAFLEDIEGSAYGSTPETLRQSLDSVTSNDVVWISPGIPFLVPLLLGLVAAFTYGDILFALFDMFGIAA